MTQVLLLEDEPLAANDLKKILKDLRPDYEIIEIIGSVKKAIYWLEKNNPDLILSDIQLADGTCFEIFESINKEIPIIFITAYNQYAIQAFKEFSIDYLLKPIDRKELKNALEKIGAANVIPIHTEHTGTFKLIRLGKIRLPKKGQIHEFLYIFSFFIYHGIN